MPKLDLNLDACRQMSIILHRIRKAIREELRTQQQGSIDTILPATVRSYLEQRQEREASIKWDLAESSDLLDYAGFGELFEIVSAIPGCLRRFAHLAADPAILHIRFLELQTIENRVAFARPVTEADLSFLLSFDDRLKRSLSAEPDTRHPEPPACDSTVETAAVNEPPRPAPPSTHAKARQLSPRDTESAGLLGVAASAPPEPSDTDLSTPDQKVEPAVPARQRSRAQQNVAAAVAPEASASSAEGTRAPLDSALFAEDDDQILGMLYREVTTLADALSTANITAMGTPSWERIRESGWYRKRFSSLGLKAVSDFYELLDKSRQLLSEGGSRSELREYLRDHSFPKVVLTLRSVFHTLLQ
jgi:hypothetical protein